MTNFGLLNTLKLQLVLFFFFFFLQMSCFLIGSCDTFGKSLSLCSSFTLSGYLFGTAGHCETMKLFCCPHTARWEKFDLVLRAAYVFQSPLVASCELLLTLSRHCVQTHYRR